MLTRPALERLDRDDPLGPLPRATPGRIAEVMTRERGGGPDPKLERRRLDRPGCPGGGRDRAAGGCGAGQRRRRGFRLRHLFKLLGAALALRLERSAIISERDNFPTDLHVAQGLAAFLGGRHAIRLVEPGAAMEAADEDAPVVMLSHATYRTGAMHDI